MFGLGRIRLFTAFGIDVRLHWTFLLVLLLFGVLGGKASLFVALLIFASVIVHEFGHSLVARRLGVQVAAIELHFFGGVAQMTSLPRRPRDEILIAAAGPLTSFGLAAASGLLWTVSGLQLLLSLALINLSLGVFNLLPALPMDGGRIFRAALQTKIGGLRATRIATIVARTLAVAMGIYGLFANPFLIFLAFLLWSMAGQEMRLAQMRYGGHGPGQVEVIPPGSAWQAQGQGPVNLHTLFANLAAQHPGEGHRRVVIRDSSGRVLVVEEGGFRW